MWPENESRARAYELVIDRPIETGRCNIAHELDINYGFLIWTAGVRIDMRGGSTKYPQIGAPFGRTQMLYLPSDNQ